MREHTSGSVDRNSVVGEGSLQIAMTGTVLTWDGKDLIVPTVDPPDREHKFPRIGSTINWRRSGELVFGV